MDRRIEPELLDELAADDPRAVRSRRDLNRVNAWMANAVILSGLLDALFAERPPDSIVDLGGGDGRFLLRLAKRLAPRWRPSRVRVVDRQHLLDEATTAEFTSLQWSVAPATMDVFEWLERSSRAPSDLILANLFLHHFEDDELGRLLRLVGQQTRVFLACDPRRSRLTLAATGLLRVIGCNDVTRHDARVSVRAGFADADLSSHWPDKDRWALSERRAGWVSHLFVARRSDAQSSG